MNIKQAKQYIQSNPGFTLRVVGWTAYLTIVGVMTYDAKQEYGTIIGRQSFREQLRFMRKHPVKHVLLIATTPGVIAVVADKLDEKAAEREHAEKFWDSIEDVSDLSPWNSLTDEQRTKYAGWGVIDGPLPSDYHG